MMKTRIITVLLILFTFNIAEAKEPKNLDLVKQELIQYHDTGEYAKDQTKVGFLAKSYLKARLQHPNKKPLAIVLDIDETSLSNYPDMLKLGFGGTANDKSQARNNGNDLVIQSTLELFNFAKSKNIAVFFISGRSEDMRDVTENNLKAAGFDGWKEVMLKPTDYNNLSVSTFKIDARKKIEDLGFDILLNLGDQQSDLKGGHADKTFKMPNPYYLTP
jgi:predicted secreted acid phosphatase